MVTTGHVWLLELCLKRWASMNTFVTVHWWILTNVLVADWCTQIGLTTVSCKQRYNRLGTYIGEIWWRLEGSIPSYLGSSPLLGLRWGVSYLKLSPAIEVSIVFNVWGPATTACVVMKHLNRTLSVDHYHLVGWFVRKHSLSNGQYLIVWETVAFIRSFVGLQRRGMLDVYELMIWWSCNCILLSWESHWTR